MIAFLLGTHTSVSLAELRLLFNRKESFVSKTIAFFDNLNIDEVKQNFKKLGGIIKVFEVVKVFEEYRDEENIVKYLAENIAQFPKREYVLSLYGVNCDKRNLHKLLKKTNTGIKYDGNIRESQHSPAATFYVLKRGGLEYSLIKTEKGVTLLRTIEVSDPSFWSMVDGDRPNRDMEVGMLPAKLARIMVNLSGVGYGDCLWDPFVGQGTIAMVASLIGIKTYGSDKSSDNIRMADQNMKWLLSKKLELPTDYYLETQAIEHANATKTVSGVSTEPYLGKPHFKPYKDIFMAKKEWKGISHLYEALLKVAAKTLQQGQRLVFIQPTFAFLEANQKRWYNPPLSISADIWKVPDLISDLTDISWIQKDSVVGRNLVILEKR